MYIMNLESNPEKNITTLEKISKIEYFFFIFTIILYFDIFITITFATPIWTIDYKIILVIDNLKYLIVFLLSFLLLWHIIIPFLEYLLYKAIYTIFPTSNKKRREKQADKQNYIQIDLLYRNALEEENNFKLQYLFRDIVFYKTCLFTCC